MCCWCNISNSHFAAVKCSCGGLVGASMCPSLPLVYPPRVGSSKHFLKKVLQWQRQFCLRSFISLWESPVCDLCGMLEQQQPNQDRNTDRGFSPCNPEKVICVGGERRAVAKRSSQIKRLMVSVDPFFLSVFNRNNTFVQHTDDISHFRCSEVAVFVRSSAMIY